MVYSSRYSANLIPFFVLGSACFLVRFPGMFKRREPYCKWARRLRVLLLVAVLAILFLKFFHYNPFKDYVTKTAQLIVRDSQNRDAVIVAVGYQYPYYDCNLPQYELPDFLMQGADPKAMLLRAIGQFGCRFDCIYFVIGGDRVPPIPEEMAPEGLTRLESFRKNRDGKNYLHLYRYINPHPFLMSNREAKAKEIGENIPDNLIGNGDFEEFYPRTPSKNNYYDRFTAGVKRDAIPSGALFPQNWDIYWGYGFAKGSEAKVCLTAKPESALVGQYSLYMYGRLPISILYQRLFPAANYKFRCLVRAERPSEFRLGLSLRNSLGIYQGMRDLKTISLPADGQSRLIEADLTAAVFHPYPKFYLYLILEKGEICIDHVSLTVDQPK